MIREAPHDSFLLQYKTNKTQESNKAFFCDPLDKPRRFVLVYRINQRRTALARMIGAFGLHCSFTILKKGYR